MTEARIQQFWRVNINNIGFLMELPKSGTHGNKVLFLHSNHFC